MSTPLRAYRPDLMPPEPEFRPPPTNTFLTHVQAIVDVYIVNLTARNKVDDYTDDALMNALRELRRYAAAFGHLNIWECKQHDLTVFFGMFPQLKANDTRKRVASTILGCFKWAYDEELIERCPYKWPKFLKGMPGKVRRPAEAWEYIALMRFGSRPLRRALFILRRIGIRTKEMRDLVWPEVDLGPEPFINLEKHKTRKKTGKSRKIGLDAATANWLRAIKRQRSAFGDPHVFVNCKGTPWTRHTFARHLRRYAERLGIDEGVDQRVSGYCVRHTYVCDGIESGISTRRIADQVGHTKTNVIDTVYGSHTRERVEHLNDVATEILKKRKRKPMTKKVATENGWYQGTLFNVHEASGFDDPPQ